MKNILSKLFNQEVLTKEEAKQVLLDISAEKYNPTQIAAFMTVFQMRPITVDELNGFQDALLSLCIPLDLEDMPAIDMCGTGGDGKNTFNISTTASFVVAAAGYKVAKHGNYGVSSKCGSSNVLEHLGYQFTNNTDILKRQLDETNITMLHAPLFHPAMKAVASIRRAYGLKTFFNMLGPLVNPAKPSHQFTGVYSLNLARLYKYVQEVNNRQYIVLHTLEGYDEISLTGAFKIYNNKQEAILQPDDLGLATLTAESISGGNTIEASAKIMVDVLSNQATAAQTNVVLANAAMGIQCFDFEKSYADCFAEAKEALNNGKAYRTLNKLI